MLFLACSSGTYTLFIPFPMRQANTVMTILGFTSTRSSGRAYTLAPIFLAMEMAYLKGRRHANAEQPWLRGPLQGHRHRTLSEGRGWPPHLPTQADQSWLTKLPLKHQGFPGLRMTVKHLCFSLEDLPNFYLLKLFIFICVCVCRGQRSAPGPS